MRFHKKFSRRVGAVSSDPVLGSDSAPTTAAAGAADNGVPMRVRDHTGFPVRQLTVGYRYAGAGAPKDLAASLYVLDELSESWFLASTGVLKPGQLTNLSVPPVQPSVADAVPGAPGAGVSLEAVLVVDDAGGDPDGVFTFTCAASA